MNTQALCYSYLRFSNPKQKQGDSVRRQIEAAESYAKENDLDLDKTLNMRDEGLSGFTGKHIKVGNLGKFLALIEAGKIAPGSRLVIESIDRLGRQEPLAATDVIKLILRAGIMLVVLDWYRVREFTDESIRNNPGEYSGLVAEIERAYFESKKKSERLSQAWKEKRKKASNGGKKLTGISPLWLEISEDKTEFIKKPKVVEAVNQIFRLKADGMGNTRITEALNEDPDMWQPPVSNRNKTGGWPTSTIQRIVGDKRVLGEFQPHTRIDGKREPVGEPIKNYYPPVVDEDLFYAVQNRMQRFREKHGHPGGRANKARNLFAHTAQCGDCGHPLHFIDKGSGSKGGQYLHCSLSREPKRAKNGEQCNARPILYIHFKDTFFNNITELNATEILPTADKHRKQIEKLTTSRDANGERIDDLARKEDNLIDSIAEDDSPEIRKKLKQRLEKVSAERKELALLIEKQSRQLLELEGQSKEVQQQLDSLKVRELLDSSKSEEEATEIRRKIRRVIKQLVNRIEVFGSPNSTGKYDKVKVWFNGAEPFAALLSYSDDGWSRLTRRNAPKKTA